MTDPAPRRVHGGAAPFADAAGVLGAIFAAFCCVGVPLIVSVLSSIGLSFLRRDSILLPLLALSLAIALWGFAAGRRQHGSSVPLALGLLGGGGLFAGVLAARWLVWPGAVLLIAATVWNIWARRRSRLVALSRQR